LVPHSDQWFTFQVVPRHERQVDAILGYKGCEHFLPTHQVRRKWSDRTKLVHLPLFPGYIFCRSRSSLMDVARSTPGVIRVVSFGGKPHPVPSEEIDALRRVVQAQRDVCSVRYLNAGRKVRVIAGPLAGLTGIIAQIRRRHRLIVSIDLIMKSASVEIDESEVAPV
jgi:transcription antitermination factor NusG